RAALDRWPGNLPAAIGLANQHHQRGAVLEAALILRQALKRHPESTVVMNNLAQTLSDQGRNGEALLQIDQALALHGPYESEVIATRQLILERMGRQGVAVRAAP
ncbi:MAG: tetratricopeptide repeat protein, partial [Burkholderiaceae bacterium]